MLDEETQARLAATSVFGRIGKPIGDRRRRRLPGLRPGVVHHRFRARRRRRTMPADRMKVANTLSVGIIGAGPGGLALGIFLKQGGFSRLHDLRPRRRRRRHLADQHLSGSGLRRQVAPLLLLVRPERELVAAVVGAAGDPGVLRTVRAALRARPAPEAEHRNRLGRLGRGIADLAADARPPVSGTGSTSWCRPSASSPSRCCRISKSWSRSPGRVMHTATLGPLGRPGRRAGGRAGHGIDGVAADARGGQGGVDTVYSVQRSPTWILPKPDRRLHRHGRSGLFAHVPFAKKFYRTRLWLRSESNISVIENGSDKTQEFKAIALRVAGGDGRRRRVASSRLTPDHPLGCKRLVFATRLPADADAAARRGGVQPGAGAAVPVAGHRRTAPNSTWTSWCAPPGYAAADYLGQIDVVGEDGVSLHETWRDGRVRLPGHGRSGLPELLHAVRTQHQRRLQQRHLHAGGAGPLHRARPETPSPAGASRTWPCAPKRWRTSSPRSTSGWRAPSGPRGAATTSGLPTAAWSRSGRAVPARSGV